MRARGKQVASRAWDATKIGAGHIKSASDWVTAAMTSPALTLAIERWSGRTFNALSDVYSKAIDGSFAHLGPIVATPWDHRILDGHDLITAFQRTMDALPDDTVLQEVWGYFGALASDMSSVVGLPLFTTSREHLEAILQVGQDLGLSHRWVLDFLHVNSVEVIGSAFPMVVALLHLKSAEREMLERLAGSLGIGSIASANPLGAVVALVMLGLSIRRARPTGAKISMKGLGAGALKSAGVWAATAVLGPVPVALGVAVLIVTAILKKKGKLGSADPALKRASEIVRRAYAQTVSKPVARQLMRRKSTVA